MDFGLWLELGADSTNIVMIYYFINTISIQSSRMQLIKVHNAGSKGNTNNFFRVL